MKISRNKKTNKKSKSKKGTKKRSLSKKKTLTKKKTSTKKSKQKKLSFNVKKLKPKQDIYVVDFPRGIKTEEKLNRNFEAINWKIKKFPSDQVNVTLYAMHGKEKGAMTYVYDLPPSGNWVQNLDEMKNIFKEMTKDIFRTKGKVKQFAGYLKEAKIKDYINRIVIDFEASK